jgi:hypothetical protein
LTPEPRILSDADLLMAVNGFVEIASPGEFPTTDAMGTVVRSHRALAERVSTLEGVLGEAAEGIDDLLPAYVAWAGFTQADYDRWNRLRARLQALAGLGADPATQDKATAGGTASGGASSDPAEDEAPTEEQIRNAGQPWLRTYDGKAVGDPDWISRRNEGTP